MICQVCGKREATVCIVKKANSFKESLYICPVCAGKLNDDILGNMSELLNPLLGEMFQSTGQYNLENNQICPGCGQTKRQWEKSGRMNCKECYGFYENPSKHLGKIPKNNREELYVINLIKEKELSLKKLITEEKYEAAALLRDELKVLREEMDHDL